MSTDLQSQLQSTLGAGYRVTRELAGGGMSRVFVAEEASLEREIVVKLLPPELMAGLNVERFRAEIRTLTAYIEHVTGEAPPEGPPTTKPRKGNPSE